MKEIIFTIMVGMALVSAAEAKDYKDSCLLETKTIPADAVIIDVRTTQEFTFNHPKGATNIPYLIEKDGERIPNQNFIAEVNKLTGEDYSKHLIIICQTGVRSVDASKALLDEGYEDLTNIQKGFVNGWKKAGLPVEK